MRVTQHSGRIHRTGKTYSTKHNDRNFDSEAENIDKEKTPQNRNWNWHDSYAANLSIEEAEKLYYEEHYGPQLERTNEKYRKNSHKERIKTMDQWRKQRIHAPEEVIIQIGNISSRPDLQVFEKCFNEYLNELGLWNKNHDKHMHILDWSLHQDEKGAPHVHMRRVWDYYNPETKQLELGQEKALEQAGVPLPHPDKPIGRYNNRKIAFDNMMREKWQEIAQKNGLEIETETKPKNEVGKPLDQFILEKEAKLKKKQKEIERKRKELEEKEELQKKKEAELIDKEKNFNQLKKTELDFINHKQYELQEKELQQTQLEAYLREMEEGNLQVKQLLENKEKELVTKNEELNKNYEKAKNNLDEQQKLLEEKEKEIKENQKEIDAFNNTFTEKLRKYDEWSIAEETIEKIQPENWIKKLWSDLTKDKNVPKFINTVVNGIKGFITEVKKSYDELLYGHKRKYTNSQGENLCEYSYGYKDFTEMLRQTPVDDIQLAINECKQKNKKTFQEAEAEEGLSFYEKFFTRAKEKKREIKRDMDRGITR